MGFDDLNVLRAATLDGTGVGLLAVLNTGGLPGDLGLAPGVLTGSLFPAAVGALGGILAQSLAEVMCLHLFGGVTAGTGIPVAGLVGAQLVHVVTQLLDGGLLLGDLVALGADQLGGLTGGGTGGLDGGLLGILDGLAVGFDDLNVLRAATLDGTGIGLLAVGDAGDFLGDLGLAPDMFARGLHIVTILVGTGGIFLTGRALGVLMGGHLLGLAAAGTLLPVAGLVPVPHGRLVVVAQLLDGGLFDRHGFAAVRAEALRGQLTVLGTGGLDNDLGFHVLVLTACCTDRHTPAACDGCRQQRRKHAFSDLFHLIDSFLCYGSNLFDDGYILHL